MPRSRMFLPGPIFVVEGFSDCVAATALGMAAVGRPSATGGVPYLAELLGTMDREVIVLGENDAKDGGFWPGRDGAIQVATQLSQLLGREVRWNLPPAGYKDLRDYYIRTKEPHVHLQQ